MILFILLFLVCPSLSSAIESVKTGDQSVLFTPEQHQATFTNFKTGHKQTVTMDRPVLTVLLFEEKDRKDCGCWGYVITHDKPATCPQIVDMTSMSLSLCHERAQARDAVRELKPVTLFFHPLQQNTAGTGTDDDDESAPSTLHMSGHPFEVKINTKDNWVTHLDGTNLFIFSKKGGDYNLIDLKDPLIREGSPEKFLFNFPFDFYAFDGDRGLFVQNDSTSMQSYIFEVRLYTNDKIGSIVPAPTTQLAYDVETHKPYVLTHGGAYNARHASLEVAFPKKQRSIKVHEGILFACDQEGNWSAIPLARPGKGDNPSYNFPLTMEPKGDFPSLRYLLPPDCQNGRFLRILDKDVAFYEGLAWVPTLPLEEIFDWFDESPEHVLYTMAQIKPCMVEKMKYFKSLEWKKRRKELLKKIMEIWSKDQPRAQKLALLYYSLQLSTEPTRQELAFWE